MRMPKEHTRRGRPPPPTSLTRSCYIQPAAARREPLNQHRPCALLERLRRNFIQYFLLALLKLLQHNLAQHTLSRTYEVHFTMDNVILLCKSN
ncbi:hypothetical protein C6341_g14313 [Phytophthora cactorum]|nr:hypothetical protein C6341_g14313 [Phytophthora cactorum]